MALTTDNKSSRLFKALMGVSETRLARDFFEEPIRTAASVLPNQIWKYGDKIPTGDAETGGADSINAVRTLGHGQEFNVRFDESTVRPIVRRWVNLQLTMIDGGTHNSFKAVDGQGNPIQNIIPFNFGDGITYNYSLTKADNSPIAFGVGDWVLDTQSGVLTFYSTVPDGVNALNPPKLSFYEYVGGFGVPETVSGFEGAIIPLQNFQGAVNTSAWNTEDTPALASLISNGVDTAYADFIATYGWDGADDNEGIAVAFEKIIPLRYSHSQDAVKSGIGMAANAEVETLIARRHISTNTSLLTGLTVDFASQQIPIAAGLVQLKYNAGTLQLSLDSGNTWGSAVSGVNTLATGSVVKVKNGSAFVVVRRTAGNLPTDADVIDSLGITDQHTTVGLFYWNSDLNEYTPWVNNDAASKFDFGIPVVLKLGKIPASIKLSQTSTGGFTDSITPEYYGVRPQTVVLAVLEANTANNTPSPEGVDYLVKNEPGSYLEDVIAKVFAERGAFAGTIYLRSGRYKVNTDFSLSNQAGLQILGESRDSVFVQAEGGQRTLNITASTVPSRVYIERLQFVGSFNINIETTGSASGYAAITDVWGPDTDITVSNNCDLTILNAPALHDLNISGTADSLGDRLVESAVFNNVVHNGTNVIYRNIKAATFEGLGSGTESWIDSSYINSLISLEENNQYSNNTILAFDANVPERFKMSTGKFEVIDNSDRPGERRWVDFADPIMYDVIDKRFKLIVDDYTMEIKDGKLFVKASADVISFDPTNAARPYDSIETPGPDVTATNVQEALEDLYATKADLISGKLPLQQLPDAIAHGGLSYKGMWSFETNTGAAGGADGAYPVYADLSAYDFDNVDEFPGALKPGWFVVVKYSTQVNNPAAEQEAEDGQFYTAGDWAVYNGVGWEKVDNSIADAVYSILPDVTPDGQLWDEASGGDGLLALGSTTIVEGMDQVNEILKKLAPPKPINLNQLVLSAKTSGYYTATETATGSVRSSRVWDNARVVVGTNDGADDITNLFFDGDNGLLEGFIDTVSIGSKALSVANDEGTYDQLVILDDVDPHAGVSGKEDFWKGLRARIVPTEDLALGPHNYRIEHSISGSTPEYTLYVDNPAAVMAIEGAALITIPQATARWLSGAPSIDGSSQFTISPFTAAGVVGKFYNSSQVARITCNVPGVSTVNLDPNTAPVEPLDGEYTGAGCNSASINMPSSAYSESVRFTITPYNSKGGTGTPTTLDAGRRIDTASEHYGAFTRVRSGDETSRYPVVGTLDGECGAAFNSQQSLIAAGYEGELQKIGYDGGQYRWPDGNYAAFGGPNYTGAIGNTIGGDGAPSGQWRWVTFKAPAAFANTSAFTLALDNAKGGWTADANKITANVMIFVKVVGASGTGWLNANSPYSGSGVPLTDNDPAMVAGDSDTSASQKRITFGPETRTGDLYIRVAINQTSGLTFAGVSIKNLA